MGASEISLQALLLLVAHTAQPSDAQEGPVRTAGPSPATPRPAPRAEQAPIPVPPPTGRPAAADPFTDAPRKADMSPSTDLSRTWGYSKSKSPPKPLFADDPSAAEVTPNPIGFYSGVRVANAGVVPPWAPADPAAVPPTLTWPGFERGPRSSRVFFQISRKTTYTIEREGNVIRVRFAGTRIDVRNNTRPLDLRFHKTPVSQVVVRRSGDDTVATLRLEAPAEPTVQTVDAPNGYFLVILEFPDAPGPAAAPAGAPGS